MDTQEEIIKYLIAGVLEKEGTLGKTKLVKLLYLMDVDQYSRYRRTASGLSWKYHFYGPYDPQIESVLRRIDLDVPQEEVQTSGGARAVAFRPSNISGLLDRVRLSDRLRRSAERILDQWALADLYSVLNHVYFHTEPMMDARPAQTLDFSVIPEYQPPRPPRNLPRPGHDTLLAIRRQLAEATEHRLQLRSAAERQQSILFRTYDESYGRLMRTFAEVDERPTGLDGSILVAPPWPAEAE